MGNLIKENLDQSKYSIIYDIDKRHCELPSFIADVVIDFSTPVATMNYAPYFIEKGVPYILGTTGLNELETKKLIELATIRNSHLRISSNYDPGFNALLKSINTISSGFTSCTIEEWHYLLKKDIPSGSALSIKAQLKNIKTNIISHRVEEFVYRHSITFVNSSSTIRLFHEVKDKKVYVKGLEEALDSISLPGIFIGL